MGEAISSGKRVECEVRRMDIENPLISRTEREGMPDYGDERKCPICGKITDEIAENMYGEVVGCSECIRFREIWEYGEEEWQSIS